MTENRININRKKLTSQQIREKESLDGILNKHQKLTKRPAYRQKKYYFLLFFILLIVFLIYYADKDNPKEQQRTNTEQPN